MSVPDHLIEKAAKALAAHDDWSVDDWDDWDDYDRYSYMRHARAALEAVADELRAEGARAERERIADTVKTMLGCMSRTPENQWSRACMTELLAAIREEARHAS